MKIGDVWYEKHTVTEISQRTNTVSEAQVEKVNAIPIPDNATNGEVLDKLFPDLTYGTNGEHYHVWSNDGKCSMNIHQDFWNSPYQKGE